MKITVDVDVPENWKEIIAFKYDKEPQQMTRRDLAIEIAIAFETNMEDFTHNYNCKDDVTE